MNKEQKLQRIREGIAAKLYDMPILLTQKNGIIGVPFTRGGIPSETSYCHSYIVWSGLGIGGGYSG